jgi:propanol-preferring alcohol dehydrogenase
MRAAVLHEHRQPLRLEEVAAPVPGPGDVLVRVEACGVCHSDLHLADGDWPQLAKIVKRPLILGHEVVGRVVEVGPDVRELVPGDRVGIAWVHSTCGSCEQCGEGRENLCTAQVVTGAMVDGGFADFALARASHALRVPATLSSLEAAPLFCAGVTVFRALRNSGLAPGERLAVFGVGGLGHLAVQIGVAFGASVVAVDVDAAKLELAASLGAGLTLDASAPDLRSRFRALGGVHYALVTSAARAAYDAAFGALRRGGTLLLVGAPPEELRIAPIVMVGGEYRIVASAVGTRADLAELLEMAAAGKVRCRVEAHALDRVNLVMGALRRGAIQGRAVLIP